MPEIKIKVRDKCAEGEGVIICNNSDYTVVWDLDGEWTPYDTKTMRVNLADGSYQDVVFSGDSAPLPVLTASGWVSVGLYAGDIHTSRAARLLALSSVLTSGGSPASPAEDVYAQIMAKLNELSTVSPEDIAKAVEDYLAEVDGHVTEAPSGMGGCIVAPHRVQRNLQMPISPKMQISATTLICGITRLWKAPRLGARCITSGIPCRPITATSST